MSRKSKRNKQEVVEIPFVILTNEPNQMKVNILQLLYQSAHMQQLAYMDGMDPDTGEIVPLLVGMEPTEDNQVRLYPLARLFTKASEIKTYLTPDGQGSYDNLRPQTESGETQQGKSPTIRESAD